MIKLILCLIVSIQLACAQHNGIIWDVNPQYQPQQQYNQQPIYPQYQYDEKYREAAEEPVVGSPLLPIVPPIIGPKLFPLGVPGLRFSNLNAGRFGNLLYGNTLLGAENPMADDTPGIGDYSADPDAYPENQYNPPNASPSSDPQISAIPDQSELGGGKFWWKKWANPDAQAESIVSASPCGQNYQHYQVSSPQSYQEYQVSSPYQSYQPQQAYASYQPALPQIYSDYQPTPQQYNYYGAKSSSQYEHPAQPASSGALIVQPSGTYEDSGKAPAHGKDERTWDWHWDKSDKKDKKDKFNKGHKDYHKDDHGSGYTKVFYKGAYKVPVHPEPHYHPQPTYHYHAPQPVYTKPAPSYNNYYNAYRSKDMEAEQPLGSEVKSDQVAKNKELTITTTETPSNKSTTTVSCFSTNDITTKTITTSTTDDKDLIVDTTTTEKSNKKNKEEKKPKKSSRRRRRSIPDTVTNSKRCITFPNPPPFGFPLLGSTNPISIGTNPILGAPNPNAESEPTTLDQESNPSDNCESGDCSNVGEQAEEVPAEDTVPVPSRQQFRGLNPERVQQLFAKMGEPYLGAVQDENQKLWDNTAMMGRLMGPLEDTYLEFIKHNGNLPQLQDVRIIT